MLSLRVNLNTILKSKLYLFMGKTKADIEAIVEAWREGNKGEESASEVG